MKLIKYRDTGTGNQYTYFYVDSNEKTISPFFDCEKEAEAWLKERIDQFDNWKANKDLS